MKPFGLVSVESTFESMINFWPINVLFVTAYAMVEVLGSISVFLLLLLSSLSLLLLIDAYVMHATSAMLSNAESITNIVEIEVLAYCFDSLFVVKQK